MLSNKASRRFSGQRTPTLQPTLVLKSTRDDLSSFPFIKQGGGRMVTKLGLKLLELTQEYDSITKALEKAACYEGILDKDRKRLSSKRSTLKDQMEGITSDIVRSMGLSKNVIAVRDNWFIIRYIDKQANTKIVLDVLEPKDLYVVQRDGRNERELQEGELTTLLPGIIDIGGRKNYEAEVDRITEQLLYDIAGIVPVNEPEYIPEPVPMPLEHIMSNHAGVRWIQRMLELHTSNEEDAKQYLKEHYNEIEEEVLQAASKAKIVWKDEEGIEYLFDSGNVMYVRGEKGRIITLYEVDFGFNEDINRTITLQQLKVIKACGEEVQQYKDEQAKMSKDSSKELQTIGDEIKFYEAKINTLKSKASTMGYQLTEADRKVAEARAKLKLESNKIFKPNELV
jgi:hypothetical protein